MTIQTATRALNPSFVLAGAAQALRRVGDPESPPLATAPKGQLKVGVDIGAAYQVLVVLDEEDNPLAGEYQFAQVARGWPGVDFVGALDRVTAMKARVEQRLGRQLTHAASAYPPGYSGVKSSALWFRSNPCL